MEADCDESHAEKHKEEQCLEDNGKESHEENGVDGTVPQQQEKLSKVLHFVHQLLN